MPASSLRFLFCGTCLIIQTMTAPARCCSNLCAVLGHEVRQTPSYKLLRLHGTLVAVLKVSRHAQGRNRCIPPECLVLLGSTPKTRGGCLELTSPISPRNKTHQCIACSEELPLRRAVNRGFAINDFPRPGDAGIPAMEMPVDSY